MKPLYENPNEICFAFSPEGESFVYGDTTYPIQYKFSQTEEVGVEVNASGQLVFYPKSSPELRWAISRHAFLSGVAAIGAAGADQADMATYFVWFPNKHPATNFAVTRAVFEFGLGLVMFALEKHDLSGADIAPIDRGAQRRSQNRK